MEIISEVEIPLFLNTYVDGKVKLEYYKVGDRMSEAVKAKVKGVSRGLVLDRNRNPIPKNKSVAGAQKVKTINGQNLYNGTMHFITRSRVMAELKAFFTPYVLQLQPPSEFPIKVIYEIHCDWGRKDLSNTAMIYVKAIEDAMVAAKIIPDDNTNYIQAYEPLAFHCDNDQRKILLKLVKIN